MIRIKPLLWRHPLKPFATIGFLILLCNPVIAGNQLYTGDANTVPPGQVQLQVYNDSTPSRQYRLAGTIVTPGVTDNFNARFAYGYLWNNQGPNVRLGPNIGFKWRFMGNGTTKPSVAFSGICSINENIDDKPHKNDYGALLILQYPTRQAVFLGNFGRVWVGDNKPDLYFISLASVWQISKPVLFAIEYSDLRNIGSIEDKGLDTQFAIGSVYSPDKRWSYSLQLAYLPFNPNIHFHTTVGISRYF